MVCMVCRVGQKDHPRLDKTIENIDFFRSGPGVLQKPGEVARLLTV